MPVVPLLRLLLLILLVPLLMHGLFSLVLPLMYGLPSLVPWVILLLLRLMLWLSLIRRVAFTVALAAFAATVASPPPAPPALAATSGFETSGQGMAAVGPVQALVELFHSDEATLRRKKTDRDQRPVFPSETSKFTPLILAYRGSALPWLVEIELFSALAEYGVYSPDTALPDFLRKCPLPFVYHHLPKSTKLELGRCGPGEHLPQPTISLLRLNRPGFKTS